MSEFSKAMKNKEGKVFLKNKDKLECVGNCDITDTLSELCVDRFKANRREYKKFSSILNLKMFLKYDVPLIACLIGTGFVLKTPKYETVVPYYNLKQTMISDAKLVEDVDTNNYIVSPIGYEVGSDYLEVDNVNEVIQYQVKSGTRSAIVTVGLDEEGGMQVVDSLVGNFFDRNTDVFDGIEDTTLDEKYQELIEDIGDFVIESQSLNSNTKKEIKKLLESEKVNIITTVAEYVQVGELNLEETSGNLHLRMFLRECAVLLVTFMLWFVYENILGAKEIKRLSCDNDKLSYGESYGKDKIYLKSTRDSAKNLFVKADNVRRAEIKRLVKENLTEESQAHFKY